MSHYCNCMDAKKAITKIKNKNRRCSRWGIIGALICVAIGNMLFSGCAFMPFCADGRLFEKDRIAQIVEHESTRQQILDLFGEPVETNSPDSADASFWKYRYVYLGALTVERTNLGIYFDGDIVSRFQFNTNESQY